ncbi:MAG: selenocysteine-specific translation elongation factor [Phycisphaerae bacterium]|nr:selenocysteine-specific translation elongation factor [Phycisphaerae bacterium]
MADADTSTRSVGLEGERYLILGTAGHIDHGKTTLVQALTGTNTDRLPEEKQRGMTIELGFAELAVGRFRFGVVDVPGHERFVRTMVSGATGIDLALLVVAADDSVMPQTTEHLDILTLLNVRTGVVAVTKADLVDRNLVELVEQELREILASTPLKDAPIVPVSAVTGAGMEALKKALVDVAGRIPAREARVPFHMALDRVFTVQGRGTVVTGSVLRGHVSVGESLEVWPQGTPCKVRDMQTHGRHADRLERGQRAALNLIGTERESLERGCALATPGYLAASRILDARLTCLSSCPRPIRPSSRVRLCLGTQELLVRIVPLEPGPLAPGTTGYVQLRAGESTVAAHGQRFIIRDESATRTIGGGVVLRCRARRWMPDRQAERAGLAALDSPDELVRVAEVLRFWGFHPPADLALCAQAGVELSDLPSLYAALDAQGLRVSLDGGPGRVSAAGVDAFLERAARWLDRYHKARPDVPGCRLDAFLGWLDRKSEKGLGRSLLDRLVKQGRVKRLGQYVCRPEFAPELSAQDEKVLNAMVAEYHAAAFQPPALDGLKVAKEATRQRLLRLVKVAQAFSQLIEVQNGLYLHADRERELRDAVRKLAEAGPGVTVSQLREYLGSSRKYMVPIVEYLDRVGFTRREGDLRFVNEEHAQ